MGEGVKWYRVVDPLNPLCGSDVRFSNVDFDRFSFLKDNPNAFGTVAAMRRVDVFIGDRPFQLVAPTGEDLGLMIKLSHISESPLQDDVVETGTDRPHGICIDESEMTRRDGVTLRIARYERAIQIAVEDADENLIGTCTEVSDLRDTWCQVIIDMFERGDDQDDIGYALTNWSP